MRKVREERVRGVKVARIENGVERPNRQHEGDGYKGDLDRIGYRGHDEGLKEEAQSDDAAGSINRV